MECITDKTIKIMTEKQKQLLVKALCGYLPYGLKIYREKPSFLEEEGRHIQEVQGIDIELEILLTNTFARIEEMKPYLRPMSSMTEDERNEMKKMLCPTGTGSFDEEGLIIPMSHFGDKIHYDFISRILDWLNTHHFDYRNLIEKGLALEAPEDMYKYEKGGDE